MAAGLPGGMLGSLAGMPHRTEQASTRVQNAQNRVSSLPANATPQQVTSANNNLSNAQFAQTVNNVHNAATIASSLQPTNGDGTPDVSSPGWSSPNSVGNLYT